MVDAGLAKATLICYPVIEAFEAATRRVRKNGNGGEPAELYFVTPNQWASFFREMDDTALVETYINWYIQHRLVVETLLQREAKIRLLTLQGIPLGGALVEALSTAPGRAGRLRAGISLLSAWGRFKEPVGVGVAIHAADGEVLAMAAGWNTGLADANAVWEAAVSWAKENGAAEVIPVVNPGAPDGAFPVAVEGGKTFIPVLDAKASSKSGKSGKVVPLRPKKSDL